MKKIGEILIEAGKVSERDIDRALLAQREMGRVHNDGRYGFTD